MPNEFRLLFKETYANEYLTYFRLPGSKHNIEIPDDQIIFEKAVLIRPGNDVTIIAVGPQLKTVMVSIDKLDKLGIDTEIIYLHTIKPFDYDLVNKSIHKTRKYLVIEEHSQFGGVGDEVMRAGLEINGVKAAFINIPNRFSHWYGTYSEHCTALGMTPENVVRKVIDLCSQS
jgi:transketolase